MFGDMEAEVRGQATGPMLGAGRALKIRYVSEEFEFEKASQLLIKREALNEILKSFGIRVSGLCQIHFCGQSSVQVVVYAAWHQDYHEEEKYNELLPTDAEIGATVRAGIIQWLQGFKPFSCDENKVLLPTEAEVAEAEIIRTLFAGYVKHS